MIKKSTRHTLYVARCMLLTQRLPRRRLLAMTMSRYSLFFIHAIRYTLFVAMLFYVSSSYAFTAAVLKSSDIKPYSEAVEGFEEQCGCAVEEFNLADLDRLDVLKTLLNVNPDLILVVGFDALTVAHAEIMSIRRLPVVYAMIPQFPSFVLDDNNISGVTMRVGAGRYLDAILDILPGAKRVGVVYDPKNLEPFVKEAVEAARAKGVELVLRKVSRPADAPSLIDGLKGTVDTVWMLPDITVINPIIVEHLLLFSFQNRIPVFTFSRKYVELGAVASLDIIPSDIGRQAGGIAKELITGKSKPPVRVDAKKAVLAINRRIALKLGIKIRDEILKKADVVN